MSDNNALQASTLATVTDALGFVLSKLNPTVGFVWNLNANVSMQMGAVLEELIQPDANVRLISQEYGLTINSDITGLTAALVDTAAVGATVAGVTLSSTVEAGVAVLSIFALALGVASNQTFHDIATDPNFWTAFGQDYENGKINSINSYFKDNYNIDLPKKLAEGLTLWREGVFSGITHLGFLLPPAIGNIFSLAQVFTQPRRDPLTLDLDGDGLETVGTAAGILFDHVANGIKTGTGWVASDDAFLVRDINGNGTIDNGRELFGDATMKSNGQLAADGFDALADLDSNADGQITSADSAYSSLRLWRDLNQDGISQSGELFTLDDLGIASINVASTEHSKLLSNGNQVADLGTYTKTDGTTGSTGEVSGDLGDINLATDTFHRSFTDTLDTTAVATLPDMQGSGAVRDLKEAASQSAALAATLASLGPNTTRDQLKAAIPTVMQQWADGAAFTDSFEAAAADGKDLFFVPPGVSVLDAYNARYAVTTKYTSINGTQGTVALTVANDGEWRVVA